MSIYGSIYELSVAIPFNKELSASFQTASCTERADLGWAPSHTLLQRWYQLSVFCTDMLIAFFWYLAFSI